MGSTFGRVCLEAFDRNPADFGRTVMAILERDYGIAPFKKLFVLLFKVRQLLLKLFVERRKSAIRCPDIFG